MGKGNVFLRALVIGTIVLTLSITGCKPGEEIIGNPVPVISSFSPAAKVIHMPSFTLTVEGSGFMESSVIYFNGQVKETQYVSATELSCTITADDITVSPTPVAATGIKSETLIPILVQNPAPGGGDSAAMNFTLRSNFTFSVSTAIPFIEGTNDAAVDKEGNVSIIYIYSRYWTVVGIEFIRSTDGGDSWSTPIRVVETDDYNSGGTPSIAIGSDGIMHAAAYLGSCLYYYQSADNGVTWEQKTGLDCSTFPISPDIVIDSNGGINIIYARSDYGGFNPIFLHRSTDNGNTFAFISNIYPPALQNYDKFYGSPDVAVDSNQHITVTWIGPLDSDDNDDSKIYCNSSSDGVNWGEAVFVADPTSYTLTVSPDNSLNVFADGSHNTIRYLSTDGGTSWSSAIDVTPPNSNTHSISVAIDSVGNMGLIYVNAGVCYFQRSINNGHTWGSPVAIIDCYWHNKLMTDGTGNFYFTIRESNGSSTLRLVKSDG